MTKEKIKTLIKKVSTQKNFGGKMFYDTRNIKSLDN